MDSDARKPRFSFHPPRRVTNLLLGGAAALCLGVLLIDSHSLTLAQTATTEATAEATSSTSASTTQIVAAANAFLATLTDAQRAAVVFDFDDQTQKENWSNFPTGLYNRAGLNYGAMTADQQTAIMALLKVALSEQGYQKVINIMTGDEVLLQSGEGAQVAGGTFGFGQYYVSFLGTPSETDPWMLQWGGHHLGLNITFDGSNEVLTPSHTGCQPCTYILNDQQVNVLGPEYTKAQALANALDATEQATAKLSYSVSDLVDGPGEEDRVIAPEGLPGSSMTADQQALLLDLISEWVDIAPDAAAQARMAEIKTHIADTYFAWSGDITAANGTYFRVTGPTLLIEFAPQSLGAAATSGSGSGGAGGGGFPGGGNGTPPVGAGGPNGGSGGPGGSDAAATAVPGSDFRLDLGTFSVINDATALYHVHTIYRDPTDPYGSALTSGN